MVLLLLLLLLLYGFFVARLGRRRRRRRRALNRSERNGRLNSEMSAERRRWGADARDSTPHYNIRKS